MAKGSEKFVLNFYGFFKKILGYFIVIFEEFFS